MYAKKEKLKNMIFVLPLLIIITIFAFYPATNVIILSFYKKYLNGQMVFVGFQNFQNFFAKDYALQIIGNTLLWVGLGVLCKMVLSFIIALVLNKNYVGKKSVMQLLIIPWAMPTVIACIVWKMMYNPIFGYINSTLMYFNIIDSPLTWLSDPVFGFYAVLAVNVWCTLPLGILNISSAMATIPGYFYEAAKLDGASGFSLVKNVTIPLIAPVLKMLALLYSIWSFNAFDVIFMLTAGGPVHRTETLVVNIYQTGFEANDIGMASAISVICLSILTMVSMFYLYSAKKGVSYE